MLRLFYRFEKAEWTYCLATIYGLFLKFNLPTDSTSLAYRRLGGTRGYYNRIDFEIKVLDLLT